MEEILISERWRIEGVTELLGRTLRATSWIIQKPVDRTETLKSRV